MTMYLLCMTIISGFMFGLNLRLENFTLSISAVNLFVWAALFINSSVQLIVLIRPLLKI